MVELTAATYYWVEPVVITLAAPPLKIIWLPFIVIYRIYCELLLDAVAV